MPTRQPGMPNKTVRIIRFLMLVAARKERSCFLYSGGGEPVLLYRELSLIPRLRASRRAGLVKPPGATISLRPLACSRLTVPESTRRAQSLTSTSPEQSARPGPPRCLRLRTWQARCSVACQLELAGRFERLGLAFALVFRCDDDARAATRAIPAAPRIRGSIGPASRSFDRQARGSL